MGSFLDYLQDLRKRKKSSSFTAYCCKEILEKDQDKSIKIIEHNHGKEGRKNIGTDLQCPAEKGIHESPPLEADTESSFCITPVFNKTHEIRECQIKQGIK